MHTVHPPTGGSSPQQKAFDLLGLAAPQSGAGIPMHSPAKCRTEAPPWYGERQRIPNEVTAFDSAPADYNGRRIFHPKHPERVAAGAAHPTDIKLVPRESIVSVLPLQFDAEGHPLTPLGPTGLAGLGELYRYGANFTADVIIRTFDPNDRCWKMLCITRDDCHQRAIIGGFHDGGESIKESACREVKEEVRLEIDPARLRPVYQGPVDDRRTTDNAWIETTLFDYVVPYEEALKLAPKASDDAEAVDWVPMTEDVFDKMYASHGLFARLVLNS